jgi:hypothetical protein
MNPGIDVSTPMNICVLDKTTKYSYSSIAMMTIDFGPVSDPLC